MRAQRVVGSGRHHRRQVRAFRPDRFRHIPGGLLPLADHLRAPRRRGPAFPADTHREGDHRPAVGLEEVEPLIAEIEDQPLMRGLRHDMGGRNQDLGARARQPRIDIGIRGAELGIADIEASGQVDQRVLVARPIAQHLADHRGIGGLVPDRRLGRRHGALGRRREPQGQGASARDRQCRSADGRNRSLSHTPYTHAPAARYAVPTGIVRTPPPQRSRRPAAASFARCVSSARLAPRLYQTASSEGVKWIAS